MAFGQVSFVVVGEWILWRRPRRNRSFQPSNNIGAERKSTAPIAIHHIVGNESQTGAVHSQLQQFCHKLPDLVSMIS